MRGRPKKKHEVQLTPIEQEFKNKFVDSIIEVSSVERYFKNPDGSRGVRVCGAIRVRDGKRCLSPAGEATDHKGVGLCISHDRGYAGKNSWRELAASLAQGTTLGTLLDNSNNLEVDISNLTDEILFQQSLLLYWVNYIMHRNDGKLDDDGNPIDPKFTKEDLFILKVLNIDMVHAKESAARIKGSMKLDALTVKQFIDMTMSFLLKELSSKGLTKQDVVEIMSRMSKEVFAPMAAMSLISGDMTPIAQIPENLRDMRLVEKSQERKEKGY